MPHYAQYTRILELLADVKIGVVLVELAKDPHEQTSKDAMEVLADLFRTILHSVRGEHEQETKEMVQRAVSACLEEFYESPWLPTRLLDELLLAIGQGPKVLVVTNAPVNSNSGKKSSKNNTGTVHEEQMNPAYMVAAAVIRNTEDRLSTPIANLLNGLLNKDPHFCSESCISTESTNLAQPRLQDQELQADVWSVVYEFHKIALEILTTVIGNVASGLEIRDAEQRLIVTQLLGKLFSSQAHALADRFRPCFHDWLKRALDIEVEIRQSVFDSLLKMLSHKTIAEDTMETVIDHLICYVEDETTHDLRMHVLHELCAAAYSNDKLPPQLLHAVSGLLSSKVKAERKDALTGLGRIYHRQYTTKVLKAVNAGGDDVPLEVVLSTLHPKETSLLDEKYSWIPERILRALSYSEQSDSDMRTRVLQVLDDLLLGSEMSESKKMTSTARATGLAKILDTLDEDESAYQWMCCWMQNRAKLQKTLSQYLDARDELRSFDDVESIEFMTANAKAEELLDIVASLTAPISGSKNDEEGDRHPVLQKIHTAKDKHIFRVLSTICSPTHSVKAKTRALEDLPKRLKPLGEAASSWVKSLIRRCTMGDFMNELIIRTCILLAQECFNADEVDACMSFLNCVKVAAKYYPEFCVSQESFGTLTELFSDGRQVSDPALKKQIEDSGMINVLSGILAAVAPARSKVSNSRRCELEGLIFVVNRSNDSLL
jgi:hypothetical protein